jgi:Peptidase A4 family
MRRSTSLIAGALTTIAILLVAAAPAAAKHAGPRGLGPIEGRLHVGHGRTYSSNWAGYANYQEGTTFTQVEGSWKQPAANCESMKRRQFALAAFWVGLDGYENSTVEQIGTEADCEGKEPVYYAWWELYPERFYVIELEGEEAPVLPEDELHAEVDTNGGEGPGMLKLEDKTRPWTFTHEFQLGSLEFSSAEWIAEKSFTRFTDFGSVHFSGARATAAAEGGPAPISTWSNDAISIATGNPRHPKFLAEPGGLEEAGTAFTVNQP